MVWVKSNAGDERTSLSGAGTKLSFSYGMLDASVSYAFPIKKEDFMPSTSTTSIYVGVKRRL